MTTPEPMPGDASFAGEPRRPVEGRMVAGVGLCISRQLGLDATLVRLVIVATCLLGGIGLPLCLAGWLLIPGEGTGLCVASDLMARAGDRAVARRG